ncbi:hypothetical protein [Frankia sp. AgPm24]|uniref:hypothetical protein n=1 Tax=Frankia sp. AgPm24 TaxID=631128 RepID=UPI00200FD3D0|nr:hypothetical protein [Frankia sp. AgPm24]
MEAGSTPATTSAEDVRISITTTVENYLSDPARPAAGYSSLPALRHPLGFTCQPLLRGPVGVCVHLWSTGMAASQPTTSPFHCHSWDLYSLVLDGTVQNHHLDLAAVETGPTYRVFEIHSTNDIDQIRPTSDLVSVRTRRTWVNRTRDIYHLRAGVFHHTVVPEGEACTLTVGLGRSRGTDLSLGPPGLGSQQCRRRYCEPEESNRLARQASRHLRRAAGEGLVNQLSTIAADAFLTIISEEEM